jgi:hypothetical protein
VKPFSSPGSNNLKEVMKMYELYLDGKRDPTLFKTKEDARNIAYDFWKFTGRMLKIEIKEVKNG